MPSGFVYCVCVGVSALHCLNLRCVEVLRYTVNSSACLLLVLCCFLLYFFCVLLCLRRGSALHSVFFCGSWLSVSNLVDSKAHFDARATEYGVPENLLTALKAAGFTTLGQLAFAVNRPGQETDDNKFEKWVATINGGVAPAMGAVAAVKRLHFESEIVLTSMMRSAVEQPLSDSSSPKPIPYAEKTMRLERLKRTLNGIQIEGIYEPAQSLLDECCHQHDTRVLKYLEPARCASRELEITHSKVDKRLKLDNNTLAIKESKTTPDENVSTAFHVLQCFKRRAIAYEFAGLISFDSHERCINKLMKHLSIDPPPHYQAVSLTQVLRADREVFVYCSQNCQDIRADAAGQRPLDAMLERALADYGTAFHLMPLPSTTSAPARANQGTDSVPASSNWQRPNYNGKKGKD